MPLIVVVRCLWLSLNEFLHSLGLDCSNTVFICSALELFINMSRVIINAYIWTDLFGLNQRRFKSIFDNRIVQYIVSVFCSHFDVI